MSTSDQFPSGDQPTPPQQPAPWGEPPTQPLPYGGEQQAPSAPVFGAPDPTGPAGQPSFGDPAPSAPTYGSQSYGAPTPAEHGSANAPSYGSPAPAEHGSTAAPTYGYPAPAGYGSADAPAYGSPAPAAYGSANAPGFGSPNSDPFAAQQSTASVPFVPVGGAGMPPQTPAPPKRRGWVWLLVGCGVLFLVGLLALGGCAILVASSGDDSDAVRTNDPVTTNPVESDEETVVADGATTEVDAVEEPVAEETTEAAAGELGTSRDNPAQPVVDAVLIDSYDGTTSVTIGNVNWDANAAVADANMFNETAPDGQTYITVPVTVAYEGSGSITPWLEADISYVAEDGRSYDQSYVVLDNDLTMAGDLYDGGVAEGEIAFLIPEEAKGSGVFAVAPLLSSDTIFVAAI